MFGDRVARRWECRFAQKSSLRRPCCLPVARPSACGPTISRPGGAEARPPRPPPAALPGPTTVRSAPSASADRQVGRRACRRRRECTWPPARCRGCPARRRPARPRDFAPAATPARARARRLQMIKYFHFDTMISMQREVRRGGGRRRSRRLRGRPGLRPHGSARPRW